LSVEPFQRLERPATRRRTYILGEEVPRQGLVGIFQYAPSPFCILDEVDAPLDEANIGRFTELVKEMSVQTQFVLITHSKKTMSIAPVLYGVTMQEPGVSKLVSVRFGATA